MFGVGLFKGLPARAIHLGFALLLAFLIFPLGKKEKSELSDIILACLAFCMYLYLFFL